MKTEPTLYVKQLIRDFQIPATDALQACLLSRRDREKPVWDTAIIVSISQPQKLYTDPFHFWARAFFFFTEDIQATWLFRESESLVDCRPLLVPSFASRYGEILRAYTPDESFLENQKYPQTRVELQHRTFSEPYAVLESPLIESEIAQSDGEYLAWFRANLEHRQGAR